MIDLRLALGVWLLTPFLKSCRVELNKDQKRTYLIFTLKGKTLTLCFKGITNYKS